MGYNDSDIYYNPDKFDVETLGEVDLIEESYQFEILLVQRDLKTGKFYVNTDSGCSCPSPFETFTTRESLGEPLSAQAAAARVRAAVEEVVNYPYNYDNYRPDASELVSKILSY